jgi:Tfp pilus assembly protein PilO
MLFNGFYLGIFVIRPAVAAFTKKLAVETELRSVRERLEYKIVNIDIIKKDLEEASPYIDSLSYAIPSEENLYNYLIDLVTAASKHGFVVERFRVREESDRTNILEVTLTGDLKNTAELLEEIENLKRITTTGKVDMDYEEISGNLHLILGVYKVESNI